MNSMWFKLTAVFAASLQALAGTESVGWLDNPALPIDMGASDRKALFILSRADRLIDQPGQQPEKRRLRVIVGAVVNTGAEARAEVDALHFAARDVLKSLAFRQALRAVGDAQDLREVELEPDLSDIASQGRVLMSAYELDYYQSYPSFA